MISIIVPVVDEEGALGDCLSRLATQVANRGSVEVVVVDGGSRDGTVAIARERGARVVVSPRGRGRQMNAGAEASAGDVLVFLHADTLLPDGALEAIDDALADPAVLGGGFLKSYDSSPLALRLTGWVLNNVRSRLLKRLVGTQAMFIRRSVFEGLGGYPEWPFLEDVALSDRLRKAGDISIVPLEVIASARRYLHRGVIRQILVNAVILSLYRLRVSPDRLRRLYDGLK